MRLKGRYFLDHGSERGQGKGRKIAGLRVALDVSKHLVSGDAMQSPGLGSKF